MEGKPTPLIIPRILIIPDLIIPDFFRVGQKFPFSLIIPDLIIPDISAREARREKFWGVY